MQMQFHFQDGRPKQKRHRCRNPNKIDVNSLTGEERVQIINRRNARKVGGAFAPPLKNLCRFLQENPEYGVPPEWADVVKQSVSPQSNALLYVSVTETVERKHPEEFFQ